MPDSDNGVSSNLMSDKFVFVGDIPHSSRGPLFQSTNWFISRTLH